MNDAVALVKPAVEWKEAYLAFYREWVESGEDMVPWVVARDPEDFPAMLQFLRDNEQAEKQPETWVPSSTYWLAAGGGQIVGAVNIRHRLNEKLRNAGGHIGYGIRPSARRQGYATVLLGLALRKARELGLERVLVVCDEDNRGSERTIVKNGGVPDSDFTEEDGNVVKRFWITI